MLVLEAATMASRLGMRTAIVTFDMEDIGTLSCNPAMGGLGKGHLIREIDALGGLIGMASDKSGIQFKVLNKTRGAAVQGPRAQIDRNLYKRNMMNLLKKENIKIIEDEVEDIKTEIFKGKYICFWDSSCKAWDFILQICNYYYWNIFGWKNI